MQTEEPSTEPVYITKWGLTKGILKVSGGAFVHTERGEVYFSKEGSFGTSLFIPKAEWWHTLSEAIERVKKQAHRKIVSCQQSIHQYEMLLRDEKKIKVIETGEPEDEQV